MTVSAVGLDVGGSFVKAVRLAADGTVEASEQCPTPTEPQVMIDELAGLATKLGSGLPVGVGLAGLVDVDAGILTWGPHLQGEGVAVGDALRGRLGVFVSVDNDANLALLAEVAMGSARGFAQVVMVTLGTGIGLGICLDSEVRRGAGNAGEAGHMTVDPFGEMCVCGRRGCWETQVSGRRFDEVAASMLGESSSASDLVAAALDGHSEAERYFHEAGCRLALGIETIVLLLDPEMVVVGGAAAGAGDLLLDPVRHRLGATEGAAHRRPARVAASELGPYAGAIGAAISARTLVPSP
ncbi:ROK family glucokinase [soil metagenome]